MHTHPRKSTKDSIANSHWMVVCGEDYFPDRVPQLCSSCESLAGCEQFDLMRCQAYATLTASALNQTNSEHRN